MDGHTKTVAWREELDDVRLGQHLADPDDPMALRGQVGHRRGHLGVDLGGVRGARAQDELGGGIHVPGRLHQVDEALLVGDAPDEDHARPVRVDPEPVEHVTVPVGAVLVGVDPVVDHLNPVGVDGRVARQHVRSHGGGHGDDRIGRFDRLPFRPPGQRIPPAQLLRLPRPQRFETVARHDVGDAVEHLRHVPGQVGVPRVGVDHFGRGDRVHHAQIDRERLQGGVGVAQRLVGPVGARPTRGDPKHSTLRSHSGRSARARYSTCTPAPP